MTSKHLDPPLPVRASRPDQEAAREVLKRHGWGLTQFVVACLRAVARDPDTLLDTLAGDRPEPKRRGRPAGVSTADKVLTGRS